MRDLWPFCDRRSRRELWPHPFEADFAIVTTHRPEGNDEKLVGLQQDRPSRRRVMSEGWVPELGGEDLRTGRKGGE